MSTESPLDRDLVSQLAHADHPIAAPLNDDSVHRLLERALRPTARMVLDLGCGSAEWLLRALLARPDTRAVGVDLSEVALADARRAAHDRGVGARLQTCHGDAAQFSAEHRFDVVISVGATHAFGGLLPTLEAAGSHLAPGGRMLVGEGFWAAAPSDEATQMLGELADLAATVDAVVRAGWTPVYGHVSTRQELDEYEWAWTGSLASWALDHPDDPRSAAAFSASGRHRDEWLTSYRDSFGFVCLVLRASPLRSTRERRREGS